MNSRDNRRQIEAEKALRENYELLDRIFDTTQFCIVYLDPDFNFVRVNKAYAEACGYPREYFVGKNHFDLYPGEKVEAIFREAVATRKPITLYANPFEFPDRPELGVTYWDWTVHPLMSEGGRVEGLLFALLDVTEQKRAERELLSKTALAQLLLDLAQAGNEAATTKDALRLCLQRICDFSAWTLGRIATTFDLSGDLNLPLDSIWHAADPACYESFIRASQVSYISPFKGSFVGTAVQEKRSVWIADLVVAEGFRRKRHALACGLQAAFVFPVIAQGKVVAFLEFYAEAPRPVDTALVAASETIAAQLARLIERSRAAQFNAQLAAIVENSNDAIIGRSLDGRITSWNAAAERIFGYTAREAIGRPISFLTPASLQRLDENSEALRRGIVIPARERERITKDGRAISVISSISPIRNDAGEVIASALITHDISELKEAERGLQRKAALTQLLESLARAANEAASAEDVLKLCLRRLCEFGDWVLGRVATTSELSGDFRLPGNSVWQAVDLTRYEEFIRVSPDVQAFEPRGRLMAIVLLEKKPVWIPDVGAQPSIVRSAAAHAVGIRAAFAFPVIVKSKVVAFLEFFADSPRSVDLDLIEASETIAAQLARVIERSRSEQINAQLAAIVASSNDAIFSRGMDGNILTWNASAERMFGWNAEEAIGRPVSMLLPPERIRADDTFVERAPRTEPASPVQTTHVRKDGVRMQTQVTFSPVMDPQGNVIAVSNTVRDITELVQKERALRTYATRLRELSRRLQEVEEAERHAIARELHDRIGQELSTINLLFAGMVGKLSDESRRSVGKQLDDIRGLLKSTVANVRDVMGELRPPVLDDYGLLAALRHLAAEFSRRSGIAVELSGADLNPRLPLIVETAIYRIAQEALANIAKHAQARNVKISLDEDPERVLLKIADDGAGFDTGHAPEGGKHWGMITMRERAEGAGLEFRLESAPGTGTRIELEAERADL